MPGMDPTLLAAVVGALIALVGVGVTAGAQAWQAGATRRHQLHLERLPLLRAACADFAAELRQARAANVALRNERGYYYPEHLAGREELPRHEPAAVRALEALRLVADDDLLTAAEAWLEEHYREHWDRRPEPGEPPVDLAGAEQRFFTAAKHSLALDA